MRIPFAKPSASVARDARLCRFGESSFIPIVVLLASFFAGFFPGPLAAADYEAAELLYRSGQYDEAADIAAAEVERGIWNERWSDLLIRSLLARGRYDEALETYQAAIRRYSGSIPLRMLGVEVLRMNDRDAEARLEWAEVGEQLRRSTSRYASREKLVAMGRYFARRGEDARKVLQLFYDRVRESQPDYLEAYLATAELALDKGDFRVAAETLQRAEEVDGSDPRLFYLQARAWAPSDTGRANEALERALTLNPRHVDSLLFQIDHAIDREAYERADALLTKVLQINPHEPRVWAYLAVLAHLRGDFEIEALMRAAALSTWEQNPEVDHLIGRKLSDKYRFAEGAEYQRQALIRDPNHAAASFQLAQDMLRLGNDEIGWELAEGVVEEDPYNVVAHNLVTLRDRVDGFRTLSVGDVIVRMDPREAEIYGDAVLELLGEGRELLFDKYDVQPDKPILVEIFPDQKDFAIRTFGLPGGAGFLGVCFGRLITANSPASQGERPSNWESVLWHELCHVVTLGKTKNRMPRWLSEGISVYEERQRDGAWGERMTPRYRQMLLDELTPVSRLSGAFLNPPSPIHLQFAYYQSSLVVEFLIDQHGLDSLRGVLQDLGDGLAINDALARNVGPIAKLDDQFEAYAKRRAEAFGETLRWSREEYPEQGTPEQLLAWSRERPDNYWALRAIARVKAREGEHRRAAEALETIRESGALSGERGGVLEELAGLYQTLEDTERERAVLREWVGRSSDALPGLIRLIELGREEEDWEQVRADCERVLAIQPLLPIGHQRLAEAAERLHDPKRVVTSLKSLAALDPIDRAGLNYRMAKALRDLEQPDRAKRHLLMALEDAPRYRDALRTLASWEAVESEPDEEKADQKADDLGNDEAGNGSDDRSEEQSR